jgi:hypothetical protein
VRHDDKEINNIAELISKLDAHKRLGDILWFRGQDNSAWEIEPAIARGVPDAIEKEFVYYKRFLQNASRMLDNIPHSEWGWLFLMQHYGLPTRLLDWSENPLVALYFAVSNTAHHASDGMLYVMNPFQYNAENGYITRIQNDLPTCGVDSFLDAYLVTSAITATAGSNPPMAAIGQRNSSRIYAQEGTFVIFHTDLHFFQKPKEEYESVWRYKIPARSKPAIIKELSAININDFYIFPELDKLAKKIKEMF